MKRWAIFFAGLGLCMPAGPWRPVAGMAKVPDFDYYRIILERQPFGEIAPPAEVEQVVAPPAAAGSFSRDYELRAIVYEGGRIRVGLLNKSDNKLFYLEMDETQHGVSLVDADYDAEEAVLRKGDETIVFNLRREPSASSAAVAQTPAAAPDGTSPFQALQQAQPDRRSPSSRRPFFADMRRRRSGNETNRVAGAQGFFAPSGDPPDAAAQPRPFGPFTPLSGTNQPAPFGQPVNMPSPDGSPPAPFFNFSPVPPGVEAHGFGATLESILPDDADTEIPLQPVEGDHPFRLIRENRGPFDE